MEWLRQLQQILGDRIRLVDGVDSSYDTGQIMHETEEWIAAGDKQYIVIDRKRLSGETVELIHLFLSKEESARHRSDQQWFRHLIERQWDGDHFVREVKNRRWNISLPAVIAVLHLQGGEAEGVETLLEEILSDHPGYALAAESGKKIWLFLPIRTGETLEDLQSTCAKILDTLMSELFTGGKLALSRPILHLQNLADGLREAEIALQAGSAFLGGKKVFTYGQLGLAQLLYGVVPEAKTAFLEEVLPQGKVAGLTPELRETVHAFANCGQNVSETARDLFIHRNTLLYRLDKIQEVTGKDIRRFEDLLVLWLALILHTEQTAQ